MILVLRFAFVLRRQAKAAQAMERVAEKHFLLCVTTRTLSSSDRFLHNLCYIQLWQNLADMNDAFIFSIVFLSVRFLLPKEALANGEG